MDNVRVLRYNWYTGHPEYGSFGGYLARQYDHLSTMVVLTHAPKLGNYYVIVTMKETEDGAPRTMEPVLLSGSFWLIPNIYTQIAQEISFQFCCKTETGDFEQHSEHIRGRILQSKDHDGTAVDVDPSIMFDPYKKWVESIAMAAGAIVIDSELSDDSINPVQNRVIKAALDALEQTDTELNGRLQQLDGLKNAVTDSVGYTPIDYVDGYYYATNGTSLADPVASANWKTSLVDCSEGDKFLISGRGSGNPRLYAFVNANNEIIELSASNANYTNFAVTAPANAAKMVVNTIDKTKFCYKLTESIFDERIGFLEETNNLAEIEIVNGQYYGTAGIGGTITLSPTTNSAWASAKVNCKFGDRFLITADGNAIGIQPYVFTDANGVVIEKCAKTAYTKEYITAPINAAYLILNQYNTKAKCYKVITDNAESNVGLGEITFVSGKYFVIGAVGDTVNLASPSSSVNWKSAVVRCKDTDKFIISGRGAGDAKLYAFLDSDLKVVEVTSTTTLANAVIKANAGASFLVINNYNMNDKCYAIDTTSVLDTKLNAAYEQKANYVVVDANGNGDFTSILEAAYKTANDIVVRSGTYDIIQEYKDLFGDDVWDTMVESDYNNFGRGIIVNNRKIKFEPGAVVTADYTGISLSSNPARRFSPFMMQMNAEIDGLYCECTGGWYIIHDDLGSQNTYYTNIIRNCILKGTTLRNNNCVGGGCKSRSTTIIENCYFDNGGSGKSFRYHNTSYADATPVIIIKSCYFSNILGLNYYGSQTTKMRAIVNNCKIVGGLVVASESGTGTNNNIDLYEWGNDIIE